MEQYLRNKPHKWGIKMFVIASKRGIVHDFEIYIGKETIPKEKSSTGHQRRPLNASHDFKIIYYKQKLERFVRNMRDANCA